MTNTDKISGRMRELHITQAQMCELMTEQGLKISHGTLSSRLTGKSDFSVKEIGALIKILSIDDPKEYFFLWD